MKNFLVRILLAAVVTLVVSALASSARAQQSDEDPTPVTPNQTQPAGTPHSPQQRDSAAAQNAETRDAQTQDALAFTGRVAKDQGQLVLNDPVTKLNYQFDDQEKAKPYLGKQVKVIGKLEMQSNTIHIDSIEPLQ